MLKYDPVYLEVLHYTIEPEELSKSHNIESEKKVKNLRDVTKLMG